MISCHKCHYSILSSTWFGNKTASSSYTALDKKIKDYEKCGSNKSSVVTCPAGVQTCALTITEERFRKDPYSKVQNEGKK